MKHLITSLLLVLIAFNVFSQRGKDGPGSITAAGGTIVNAYTALTANVVTGATTLNIASSSGLNPGDLIFIIQMQGARVNAGKDTIYPDVASSVPTNTTFGAINQYYNAGNNEFAEVNSVPNGTSITLDCGLKNGYSIYGNVQVIKVPRYTTLSISGSGFITAPAWNGTTGGVAVVEVQNNATISSTPSFSLTGKGFRGGGVEDATTFGGNKYGSINAIQGGYKGESIAGDTNVYKALFSGVFARGAVANGGGGGDAHNAGGGGGSNAGTLTGYDGSGNPVAGYATAWNLEGAGFATHTSPGGGRGGYTFSSSNQNPSTKAPGNAIWGGDSRENVGGFGGRPLDYSTGKLFLGGGGGTGDSNDGYARPGGNGGGMVYMLCYGSLSGAGTIVADGAAAQNTNNSGLGCTGKDGASGGGGGGTIVLNVVGGISLTAGTALSAKGGVGGNQNYGSGCTSTEAYGPGGGGGGGYIAVTGTMPSNSVAGGANGIVSGNLSNIASSFPPNGATAGGSGSTGAVTTPTLTVSASPTLCTNQSTTLTAASSNGTATINWYNAAAGGSPVASGSTYPVSYATAGTYTVYAGSCPGTYRLPVIITVNSGLALTVTSATTCAGGSATLTASGATTYTWSPGGATTATIAASPASTTVYTVNATSGSCTGSATGTITIAPQPTVSVANATICPGGSATLTASGASSYIWSPGGQTTASIVVSPSSNTTYSVTGANGTCTNSTTAMVSLASTPTVSASSASICAGQTATLTASGASTYTWSPGGVTGATFTVSPSGSSTYTVTGTANTCMAQATGSVSVTPAITLTVNSPTICPSQTATLTVSGASSYTWSPGGATTSTISASPASTAVYTINASSGVCSAVKTTTITVAAQPTVSATSLSICPGQTATITASGASSYTWSPGGQTTASISVSPVATTDYTVTGSNGACTNTAVATVSITPAPVVSVPSVTICPAQTATLVASGASTYTWNPGGATGSTFTVAPAGNSTYTVIGTANTCTAQATASVTIGSSISIAVNSPSICAGQSTTLTASGATTYTWSGSGANTNTIAVSPSSTTVYTVSGSNGSCSGTGTGTVTVNPIPTLTVTASPICSGQTATLTASGATTYTWSNGSGTATQTVTPANTTTYTVVGQSSGCSALGTATVVVTATPTISVNSATVCSGQTATLTASGATTYTWNPGNATGPTFTASPATSSVYTITGASSSCFSQPVTASVTVVSNIVIAVNSPSICSGQTATLTASGATTYTWSGSGATTNTLAVNPSVTTTFTVNGSSGACAASGTSTVTVVQGPLLTVTGASVCPNVTATLSASGATSYTWSNGFTGSTQTVSPVSTTVYTVTGNSGGCSSTATISAVVFPAPNASFNVQEGNTVSPGSTIHLNNTSTGGTVYQWVSCAGSSTVSAPSFVIADTGTCCMTLTVTSADLCSSTTTECIKVVNDAVVVIPNVFTPNGDNANDFFKITSTGLKTLHVSIFDRWGLKLYEWEGVNGYWDGKSKTGAAVPSGTYFFIYDYSDLKDQSTSGKGFLSLLKD